MKRKILGILVCTLFVFSAFASAATENNCRINNKISPKTMKVTMGNVQISSDPLDEKHPTITGATDGSILVAYDRQQSSLLSHIHIIRSDDDGNTWSKIWDTNRGDTQVGLHNWPVLCTPPGGEQIFGSWNDEASNVIYFINVTDPSDPESYSEGMGYYDADGWDYDRHTFTIAAFDENRFGIGHVGHIIVSGYDLPYSCQLISFTEGYSGSFGITGDEDYPIGYNNEIAVTSNLYWMVWDFPNEATETSDLLLKWGDPVEEGDCHIWPDVEITSSADYIDPALASSGNNLCIVCMSNDNIFGDFDLVCKYSTDEGSTWHDATVPSQPQVDDKSPEIFMLGSTVFCAFIRNNNLYLTKSTDFGQTWDDPEQINDVDGTVVEEPEAVYNSSAGIARVDTRNGNEDIYYYGLATPIITVKSISGGFGVSAIIENTGKTDATDISWSIDLDGLVLIGAHTEGTISSLAAGGSETVKAGFIFGLGKATITVTAGGATKTTEGTVLGPFVIGL